MRTIKVRELSNGTWSALGQKFTDRVSAESYALRCGAVKVRTILLDAAYTESWLENWRLTR